MNRRLPLALGLLLASASTAFAHAHLQRAEPAPQTVIMHSPRALHLSFSEGLNLRFSGVVLHDGKGRDIALGRETLGGKKGTELIVPLRGDLRRGHYTVDWHALSRDGHKTHGSYSFSVK